MVIFGSHNLSNGPPPQFADLWADSRYWIQAADELPEGWGLIKAGGSGGPTAAPTIEQFLAANLEKDARVGLDPLTCTFVQARHTQQRQRE